MFFWEYWKWWFFPESLISLFLMLFFVISLNKQVKFTQFFLHYTIMNKLNKKPYRPVLFAFTHFVKTSSLLNS